MSVSRSRSGAVFVAAAVLAVVAALSGCSHGGTPAASGAGTSPAHPRTVAPATSVPPASPPTPSPSPSTPATTTPAQPVAAALPICTTGSLKLAVGPGDGAAGSIYYPLQFTNTSGAACTMYGYPGVSLVSQPSDANLGGAAVRNPTFPKQLVTLAPGAVAHASLQVTIAANYPTAQCKPATGHWLKVYPPGEYAALFVAFTTQTCTGQVGDGSTLGIYVVRPGAAGP